MTRTEVAIAQGFDLYQNTFIVCTWPHPHLSFACILTSETALYCMLAAILSCAMTATFIITQAASSTSLLKDLLLASEEGRLHDVLSLLDGGRCKVNDEDEVCAIGAVLVCEYCVFVCLLHVSVYLSMCMIGLFCNYTSQESNKPMSGVKIQTFQPYIQGPLQ